MITMSCRQVRKRINAYLDRELTTASRSSIEKHLFTCRRCQALLKTLSFSRTYLAKLKTVPYRNFILDRELVFSSAPLQPVPALAKAAALVLVLVVLAGAGVYFSPIRRPDLAVLPAEKEVIFDTVNPTLFKISRASWISLNGKARVYKDQNSLTVDLDQGQLYFISDTSFGLKKIINVAGFQITALGTEFFIDSREDPTGRPGYQTEIQLLLGQLTVKCKQAEGFGLVQLSSGQGLKAAGPLTKSDMSSYQLSSRQLSDLAEAFKQIKQTSRWFQSHPKQNHFESGDIRIEYWKEE